MSAAIEIGRVYDPPRPEDGRRILVDRLWPRGLSKDAAELDEWCKQVAPSAELRGWYGHDPQRFEEFAARYRAELEDPQRAEAVREIAEAARQGRVTLLTATKELSLSHAAILAEAIGD
ncbi:MAG TPA: DUF488 family protein [Solirubrobacterales bacterium]|nr:DUF488 family protein [Solirubrobacterales bacterium]